MASKTCMNVHLVKTLIRLNPFACAAQGYNAVPRACYGTIKSSSWNFGGSSLHSLPGNRQLLSPSTFSLQSVYRMKSLHIADNKVSWNLGVPGIQEIEDFTPIDDTGNQKDVTEKINTCLEQGEAGRLFAVVYIRGIQHKVTSGDIIVIKYDFPPNVGDRIRLEKVLAVGGRNFSLIGQPLLSRDLVRVEATVVEKTLSQNRIWFVYRKRKNFRKFHLYREKHIMVVINSIQVAKVPTLESDDSHSSQDLPQV